MKKEAPASNTSKVTSLMASMSPNMEAHRALEFSATPLSQYPVSGHWWLVRQVCFDSIENLGTQKCNA